MILCSRSGHVELVDTVRSGGSFYKSIFTAIYGAIPVIVCIQTHGYTFKTRFTTVLQAVSVGITPYPITDNCGTACRYIAQVRIKIFAYRLPPPIIEIEAWSSIIATSRWYLSQTSRQPVSNFYVIAIIKRYTCKKIVTLTISGRGNNGSTPLILKRNFHIGNTRFAYIFYSIGIRINPNKITDCSGLGTGDHDCIFRVIFHWKRNLCCGCGSRIDNLINICVQRVIHCNRERQSQTFSCGKAVSIGCTYKVRRIMRRIRLILRSKINLYII